MSVRTLEFQCAVIDEFRRHVLRDEAERILWYELLKTTRSLANNSAESDGTQSRQDFIQKFQISLKEARESLQTLRALLHACAARDHRLEPLARECDEIIAILVASLKTAKANENRDQRSRRHNRHRPEP